MTERLTPGTNLVAAAPEDRVAAHVTMERQAFRDYDFVVGRLFDDAIRGKQILEVAEATRRTETDRLVLAISDTDRATLGDVLDRGEQQARGAWYLPESDKPLVGVIEFAYWAQQEPRFAIGAADAQRAAVELHSPDAILAWALLEPVMADLFLPFKLRSGYWLGDRRPDQMAKDWARADRIYRTLGIDTDPVDFLKDGRRWAQLTIDEVLATHDRILEAWHAAPADVGQRALVLAISDLVDRYYSKAKDGKAQRAKVLDKTLERAFTGAFGGDWLAFLAYLGEDAHPSEQIATAVAPTSLIISSGDRAAKAAAATGVPVDEIQRMLAAYWGGHDQSPVERRATVMRNWWRAFDDLHARQAPVMPSLWGLLGDRFEDAARDWMEEDGRYTPRGYLSLPPEVVAAVNELWGTTLLDRWPNAIVSEPFPHAAFATALGAGADFWHGIALTCWFLCEGPYSRTDIGGIPIYYERQIKAMENLGCPINAALFTDLREAERKLTERRPDHDDMSEHEVAPGMSIRITVGTGQTKLDGFEHLRDVVTSFRRAWMTEHLERYLQARWEEDLRAVGHAYHRHVADKAKAPTARQFAKIADTAADNWFGGDLGGIANALNISAPEPQTYNRLLPADRAGFVSQVNDLLGGKRWGEASQNLDPDEQTVLLRRWELAQNAPLAVQIWEATGEPPPLKTCGWARHRLEAAFGPETDTGWAHYIEAIQTAFRNPLASYPTSSSSPASGGKIDAPTPTASVESSVQGGAASPSPTLTGMLTSRWRRSRRSQ